jgi:hypothetical protein
MPGSVVGFSPVCLYVGRETSGVADSLVNLPPNPAKNLKIR